MANVSSCSLALPYRSFLLAFSFLFVGIYILMFECVICVRCASSSLNGEELIRDDGIPLLATLLSRCMCVVQPTTPANEPSAVIVTNVMRTFSVLSQFDTARTEILKFGGLIDDIVHCTELELAPSAVDAALQTAAHVCVSAELQDALLRAGLLW